MLCHNHCPKSSSMPFGIIIKLESTAYFIPYPGLRPPLSKGRGTVRGPLHCRFTMEMTGNGKTPLLF